MHTCDTVRVRHIITCAHAHHHHGINLWFNFHGSEPRHTDSIFADQFLPSKDDCEKNLEIPEKISAIIIIGYVFFS